MDSVDRLENSEQSSQWVHYSLDFFTVFITQGMAYDSD